MSQEIERYLQAGTRANTRRSYQQAIEHFEVSWGGFLPATSDAIVRYLVDHAGTLASSTLKLRLAALAQWHVSQGFPDPTKTPLVRQVLKGIRTLHPKPEKQAEPLQLRELEQCVAWLEQTGATARVEGDLPRLLRCWRDRALLLIGFWRAFRSDELCRLQVEHIQVRAGEGMQLFLPWSKGDRDNQGQSYQAPALARLCPVQAYSDWISLAGIARGPVFRGIDRWGHLSEQGLHPHSVIPLLRSVLKGAGLPAELYSSHSLRRGFATWATRSGWDQKALMGYVGWRDAKSALRYVDSTGLFPGQLRPLSPSLAAETVPELPSPGARPGS
ncbi:tyrosine-type recombinase/integrase [Metapseudomonas furukawaii]|uniref:site-specific integrase n=1 Tax=Metapseudomonas furukawaii TaxID=1149133 RepID=UPI00227B5819|nr:tyrosine-type recombinase/integrase [Pseudomonas furukawaii]WAG76524.1 tyrosine-type recombinase/integrase [Pseudomonas furukawaii]